MRVVLYDDETIEPLTVLHLQSWMTERLKDGQQIVIPIFRPLADPFHCGEDDIAKPIRSDRVRIWFERCLRRDEWHWFAFTRDSEDALSLKSVFLPGQWPAVHDEYRRGVSEGIVRALGLVLR